MTMQHEETSYGIIPLKKCHGQWQVMLIQHQAGHWAFPKGHPEKGENPQKTAERELFEETGLQIAQWLSPETFQDNYFFQRQGELIKKNVIYFLAEVHGEETLQVTELSHYCWLPLSEASAKITFPQTRQLWEKIQDKIKILF